MDIIWNKIEKMLGSSNREILVFGGSLEKGKSECQKLNIPLDSVLASVLINYAGICIDKWIRILGQENENHKGLLYYNRSMDDSCLAGMFIVANDVVGGIYAINISRFDNEKNIIWYFSPDILEWESLGLGYADLLVWTIKGNINKFYESMRWNNWGIDCEKVEFNQAYLIYPFLWAKECDINTASKKIITFDELMKLNFEYSKKLQL